MARIDLNQIKPHNKSRNSIHDKVFATYTTFNYAGERILQIDTYGKDSREFTGKISQSIQIDKDTAMFLLNLIKQEFNF